MISQGKQKLTKDIVAVILAAGEGKRMRSAQPKAVHEVCGEPLLFYPLAVCDELNIVERIVIVGHGAEQILARFPDINTVTQERLLGTADAVKTALSVIPEANKTILVLCADMPLLTAETVDSLIAAHELEAASATVLAADFIDPFGYGRLVRDADGRIISIVEERDATETQRAITEINTGAYCFNQNALRRALAEVNDDNDQNEYYLTDVIEVMSRNHQVVAAALCRNAQEAVGVNSRNQLAEVARLMQRRINDRLMESGVTLIDPDSAYIGPRVCIGRDTVIMPDVYLKGDIIIGERCAIGPAVRILDSMIGDDVKAEFAVIREVKTENNVSIGPFCSLRPGTYMSSSTKAGTFVEIKNSFLGEDSKVPHLSYIGDAKIGQRTNIGAGSITCNYDGIAKHETEIGDDAFIGSDTMLIAPLKVGNSAMTGAGSAISEDVPDGALGLERGEQKNVPDYIKKRRSKHDSNHKGGGRA